MTKTEKMVADLQKEAAGKMRLSVLLKMLAALRMNLTASNH